MSDHVHDENCEHDDEDGLELLRLVLVDEQMHCSLDPHVFEDDPGTWGTVLADIARNLSEALGDDLATQRKVLDEIRANFQKAFDAPAE